MSFAALVLCLSALPFLGIGLAFLVAPAEMASQVGVTLDGVTADHDVRAVYGGLQLGCAVLLLWGAARPERHGFALAAQSFLFAGLVGARSYAWLVSGAPGELGVMLHAAEAVGLACGTLALARLRTP